MSEIYDLAVGIVSDMSRLCYEFTMRVEFVLRVVYNTVRTLCELNRMYAAYYIVFKVRMIRTCNDSDLHVIMQNVSCMIQFIYDK